MEHSTAHLPERDLSAYLLGQLPDDAQQAVEVHLGECPECEERAAVASPSDALVDLLQRAAAQSVPAAPYSAFGNTESSRFDSTPGDLPDTVIAPEFTVSSISSPPAALSGHSRYRVLRLLGCGGMGSVWLAEQLVMGRPVALKVIRPELLAKAGTLERFRREMQAAAKLNHHNIAHAYDAEQIGDSHFLVMEYVAGHTLSERVKAGPLPISVACLAICDAAFGLAHAHAAGLVHRDVKPGNLIQTDEGTVKVLDFGLAISAEADSSITGENLVMGTPDYVAPEQAEDPHAADARSDIYSLGCTLYHLLSGRVPFVADSMVKKIDAHRFRDPEPIGDVPQSLWLIVAKMMAKQPAQRFQTALEVAAALEPFCSVSLAEPCNPTPQRGSEALNPKRQRVSESQPELNRSWILNCLGFHSLADASGYIAKYLLPAFVLLLGVVVYRIQTDKGELVVTADDDAEISIKQGGKEITIYDTRTKQKLVLNSGTYDLELKGKPTGLKLDIEKATLTRGKETVARIERIPPKVDPLIKPVGMIEVRSFREGLEKPEWRPRVAFSLDGNMVYAASNHFPKSILRWNRMTGDLVSQFKTAVGGFSFSLSNDRKLMSYQDSDNELVVARTSDGTVLKRLQISTANLWCSAFSPAGDRVASGEPNGKVFVWHTQSGKLVWSRQLTTSVRGLAFSPDGSKLAVVGTGLCVCKIGTDEESDPFEEGAGIDCVFTRDGKSLVAGYGTDIRLWNLNDGKIVRRFTGHVSYIESIALTSDEKHLASAAADGTIRVWDFNTGIELFRVVAHEGGVLSVAVSFDGQYLISSGKDGAVRLWQIPNKHKLTNP